MADPNRIGNWKAEEMLGSGGFGIVTLWKNQANGDSLAIKKCKWNLQNSITQKQKERWISEVEMMKQINNENIVRFHDIPEELEKVLLKNNPSNLPLLSMEYCSLGNLRDILSKAKHCCGLPERRVVSILNDISNALIYLHSFNITHRDVKPENIVLQKAPDRKLGVTYKLIDLGYAKDLNSATISFVGTLQYLAPEIFVRQNYDHTVDYWSLGIMAFELICGVRPFLPANNPMQSYKELQTKNEDVICIQLLHTGEISYTKELLNENHLNSSLKRLLQGWFKVVLQFDPSKRSLSNANDTNVFQYLQHILLTKVITVFSVCTYAFYNYEVDDSTLFSTLKNWIARDLKVNKDDLYMLSSKGCNSNYAIDFYDEDNYDAMVFVFKKSSSISDTVCTNFSRMIKSLFSNVKTEFKFGTLKMVYAHTIFLILLEKKHLTTLKAAIKLENIHLATGFKNELASFNNTCRFISTYLGEIHFYNFMYKVLEDRTNNLTQLMKEFYTQMTKLKEIVDIFNILYNRFCVLIKKRRMLEEAMAVINEKLDDYDDFERRYVDAKQLYYEVINRPQTNCVVSPVLLNILSSTFKTRDMILNDSQLLNYIKCTTKCHTVLLKLGAYNISLQESIYSIKDTLRGIVIKMLCAYRICGANTEQYGCEQNSTAALISENTSLRYKLQEFLNSSILEYKNTFKDFYDDIL